MKIFLVVACGIYFPGQGSNLDPLHREHRVLATLYHQGKSHVPQLKISGTATKTQHSQINKYKLFFKKEEMIDPFSHCSQDKTSARSWPPSVPTFSIYEIPTYLFHEFIQSWQFTPFIQEQCFTRFPKSLIHSPKTYFLSTYSVPDSTLGP